MGWRCVLVRSVVLMTILPGVSATRAQDASQLPDDPSRDVLLKSCVDCHNIDIVIGKRQSAMDWRSTVTRMSGYGPNLSADEIDHLTDYLARVRGLVSSKSKQ